MGQTNVLENARMNEKIVFLNPENVNLKFFLSMQNAGKPDLFLIKFYFYVTEKKYP